MRLLLLPLLMLLVGCISHETRVSVAADQPGATGTTSIGNATWTSPPGPPAETVDRSPLPRATAASSWRQLPDGTLCRAVVTVETPLPWWQRFPCDIASDFAPVDLTISAVAVVTPHPITPRTRAELDQEALSVGYATPAP
jgi:hypothetical protein